MSSMECDNNFATKKTANGKNGSPNNTQRRKQYILIIAAVVIFALLCILLVLLMLSGKSDAVKESFIWPPKTDSILEKYSNAAVAADNGICSEIGRDVMIKGGNAIDAAVAVTVCIGVFDAHSSGIGGGHFSTIYLKKNKKCISINARQTAPTGAHKEMFVDNPKASIYGGMSVAVPGELYGLWLAYKNFGGKIPWKDLLMPTADICRNGILVSEALALKIESNKQYILRPGSQLRFFINDETGELYRGGEVMRRPLLGNTLKMLAEADDPVQLFYNSSMTVEMINELKQNESLVTIDDMQNYRAILTEAMEVFIGDSTVACGPPPPSSAVVAMGILNILDEYNNNMNGVFNSQEDEVIFYHRFIEAMKFSYAIHSKLGDPEYVTEVMDTAKLALTKDFAKSASSKLTNKAHPKEYYGEIFASKTDHGTAHISVIDREGNAVSLTSTINTYFGSKLCSSKYGIIWNNDMDDFSTPGMSNYFDYPPLLNNFIDAGKRPLSSMSPLILYDRNSGNVKLVTGAAGGSRIITTTAYISTRVLWLNETIKEAIDAPRLHNQLVPAFTYYEERFPVMLKDALQHHGQNMTAIDIVTAATGIQVLSNGLILANSDWRKPGGYPAGY